MNSQTKSGKKVVILESNLPPTEPYEPDATQPPNKADFEISAEQDQMLVRGIRLLSQKLLDLLKILIGQGSLQLLTEKEFSLLEFDLW